MSTDAAPPSGGTPLVDKVAAVSAFAGSAILAVIAGMSVVSIALRALGFRPIQGDFELVQVFLAGCVALMLPWCQLRGGNLTVDFFTVRLARSKQRRLDAAGAVLFAAVMLLLTWRTAVGALAMRAEGETTMILGFPLWIGYAAVVPGLLLTAACALHTARVAWKQAGHE
ncbi:MAG TPA: TRAP transporter small permease [Burkholderiales bacterium]|nr:TRAP transporter small permease [Burkholderiales bacterium]